MNGRLLAVALFGSAMLLAGCHKSQPPADQNMSIIDTNLTAPPADVENVPADEGAGTTNDVTNDDLDNDDNDVD